MPQDSDTGEKTEEPTGKKISEAVSRGNIAKSADINTAALLAVALLLLSLLGGVIWEGLRGYLVHIYADLGNLKMTTTSLQGFLGEFLVLVGIFQKNYLVGMLASLRVVIGAAYILWLAKRDIFGEVNNDKIKTLKDVNFSEGSILLVNTLINIIGISAKNKNKSRSIDISKYKWVDDPIELTNNNIISTAT